MESFNAKLLAHMSWGSWTTFYFIRTNSKVLRFHGPKLLVFENIWWALHMSWMEIGVEYNFCCTFKWKLFTKEKFVRMFHQFIWLLFNEFIDSIVTAILNLRQHGLVYIILVNFSYDLFIYLCLFAKKYKLLRLNGISKCVYTFWLEQKYVHIVCIECVCSSRHVVYRIHSCDGFALAHFCQVRCQMISISPNVKLPFDSNDSASFQICLLTRRHF